ncbi:MAG: hypothetical protein IJR55_01550 [Clostridia bacterium]|nr:hypothetical protein [Clostridia bacterium]
MSKKTTNKPSPEPQKKPNLKKGLALLGACMLTSLVYFGAIAVSEAVSVASGVPFYFPISIIFIVITGIGVGAMVIINAGMGSTPPEPDQLPEKWNNEKKERFIGSFSKRKKAVKTLAFWVIALVVPVAVDLMQIWLESLIK